MWIYYYNISAQIYQSKATSHGKIVSLPPKETCTLSLLEKDFPFSKDLQEDFYISIQIKRKRLQPQNFIKKRSSTLKLPRRGVFAGCDVGALQLHAVLFSRGEGDVVGLMNESWFNLNFKA